MLVALVAGAGAAPAQAQHTPVGKATFPGSNIRCSSSQKTFLREAWQEAYRYTVRAKALIDYIASQPSDDERRRLWEQDFRGYGKAGDWRDTASPQRYFGAYNHDRLRRIQSALSDARKRFEGKTMYVITCSTVCAAEKTTTANHAVKGRIVTCKIFWQLARKPGKSHVWHITQTAVQLVHEVFHHIFVTVNGALAAIGDYHGDGIGGHTDQKYYGLENVTYLARKQNNWAVRNNDSYALFAVRVANLAVTESFTGVYAAKESADTGGFFRDMTWPQLQARKAEQAARGQYLADVETYVRGKQRLYAALWRIGTGDGVLAAADEQPFLTQRKQLEREQDLIDVEAFRSDGAWRFIGVYRKRAADAIGVGALQLDLSWKTVFDRQGKYAAKGAYLADVETYVEGGARKFLALWLVGAGAGALANVSSAAAFTKILDDRRHSQQLIDYERYVEGGVVYQVGVWRHAASGTGYARKSWTALVEHTLKNAAGSTLIDIEEDANVPLEY
jgi:hypothetical protein